MTYLLDTNVLSEVMRPVRAKMVEAWFKRTPPEKLFISVLSIGEIRKGIERLDEGERRDRLRTWLDLDIIAATRERILPVSIGVAERWGRLVADAGRSLPVIDSLLAATALHHDLEIVTRNTKHLAFPGLRVRNPWH